LIIAWPGWIVNQMVKQFVFYPFWTHTNQLSTCRIARCPKRVEAGC
jgi:hypothetical protein